jgi:hypothetical protein
MFRVFPYSRRITDTVSPSTTPPTTWGYVADGRVKSLLPADLSPKSGLYTNLQIIITGIVAQSAATLSSALG